MGGFSALKITVNRTVVGPTSWDYIVGAGHNPPTSVGGGLLDGKLGVVNYAVYPLIL